MEFPNFSWSLCISHVLLVQKKSGGDYIALSLCLYVNYGSAQTNMNNRAPDMEVASKYKTYSHERFRFSSVVSWAHAD